jgi:hypothetical protein
MNGIIQPIRMELTDEEKKQRHYALLGEIAENEKYFDDERKNLKKFESQPNSQGYSNAVYWTKYYKAEIQRLSDEYNDLNREIFGEECPINKQSDHQIANIIGSSHPDITAIVDGIRPIE